jgi:hypothetical protein
LRDAGISSAPKCESKSRSALSPPAGELLVIENEQKVFTARIALQEGQGAFFDAVIAALGAKSSCSYTLTFARQALGLPGFEARTPILGSSLPSEAPSFGHHARNGLAAVATVNPEILVSRQDDGIGERFAHAHEASIGEAHG